MGGVIGRRPGGRARRRVWWAVVASAAGHLLLGALVLPRLRGIEMPRAPQGIAVVMVPREARLSPPVPVPASGAPAPSAVAGEARATNGDRTDATPSGTSKDAAGVAAGVRAGGADGQDVDVRVALREHGQRSLAEALVPGRERRVPWSGAPGTPGGPRQPTDSIDGRARLGSGEPGDPRIPGSGGVDIAAVITRDGAVAQARERARQGQVHPFLGAVKARLEECWLPTVADANAVSAATPVSDPVCAKGYHLRRNVGRVFAIYDAKGARLAFEIDTRRDGGAAMLLRAFRERIRRAFDDTGMEEVPIELLDDRGLLRLAWNVYIDDYRGCNLVGRGANAHKPGGDEIIGIVELDGLY